MTVEEIYALPVIQYGWRVLPTGNYVKLGKGVTLGNDVTLGHYVTLGDGVKLGDCVKLGDGVKLGDDGKSFEWSPLQIQGSKHLLYVAGPTIIGVGCMRNSADWWNEHYRGVGRSEGYTDSQVEEYRQWLDIAIAYQAKLKVPA